MVRFHPGTLCACGVSFPSICGGQSSLSSSPAGTTHPRGPWGLQGLHEQLGHIGVQAGLVTQSMVLTLPSGDNGSPGQR